MKGQGFFTGIGCLIIILFLVFNVVVGAWAVDLILSWFSINIPNYADAGIGLFTAELAVPVAIVGWILQQFNVF